MSGRRALGVRWVVAAVTSLGLAAVPLGGAGAEVHPHTDGAYDEPVQLTARQITLVQRVAPQVTLEAVGDERISDKGVDLAAISAIESYDVPAAAMRAYRNAADEMASTMPGCQLPWTLLAGIGRVESDHGRYGGSVLGEDGLPRPAIRGVALNGVGPVAAIADSDDGEWDGDAVWDRAVGPMQFIPTTWAGSGRDGDGDGEQNPNDIDDAALAAAYYLCPSSGSLLDDATLSAAIYSYNHSDYYVALVKAFMVGYETGVFDIPSPPPPPSEEADEEKDKKKEGQGGRRQGRAREGHHHQAEQAQRRLGRLRWLRRWRRRLRRRWRRYRRRRRRWWRLRLGQWWWRHPDGDTHGHADHGPHRAHGHRVRRPRALRPSSARSAAWHDVLRPQ